MANVTDTSLTDNGNGNTAEDYPIWFSDGSVDPNLANLTFSANSQDAVAFGGGIMTTRTWKSLGVPYIFTGGQTVPTGATLTVEPGVQARFKESFGLLVNGALLAVGTPAEPILFTGTSAQVGWWAGIRLEAVSAANPLTGSRLSYATIEYGGYLSSRPANLYLSYAAIDVDHSVIQHSFYSGIYGAAKGVANVTDTSLTDNGNGNTAEDYPIWFSDGSVDPNLANLTFSANSQDAVAFGGGIMTTRTWKSLGVPYIFTGGQTVPTGATLTVEPGVQARFKESFGLLVNGALLAVGTPAEPILFTGTSAQVGWWAGIRLEAVSAANPLTGSRLSYATIEYGGSLSSRPANLYLSYAAIDVDHSVIQHSFYSGIYGAAKGVANVTDTSLTDNGNGNTAEDYPIWFSDGSVDPNLANLTFSANSQDAVAFGGGIMTTRTWKSLGVPYIFTGGQTVPTGATLTVEPGVQARFKESFGLLVNGALLAVGTPAEPILFTGTSAQAWLVGRHPPGGRFGCQPADRLQAELRNHRIRRLLSAPGPPTCTSVTPASRSRTA